MVMWSTEPACITGPRTVPDRSLRTCPADLSPSSPFIPTLQPSVSTAGPAPHHTDGGIFRPAGLYHRWWRLREHGTRPPPATGSAARVQHLLVHDQERPEAVEIIRCPRPAD